jgi:MFS family permease
MNAKDDADVGASLSDYSLRPARYCNIDGSSEIGWGAFLLCMALSSYTHILFPGSSGWTHALAWFLFGCGAFAPLLAPRLIKRSVTWRRTGYVAYLRGRTFWIGISVSFLTAGGLSYYLSRFRLPGMIAMSRVNATGHTNTATPAPAPAQVAMLAVFGLLLCAAIALYLIRRGKRKFAEPVSPEEMVKRAAAKPRSIRYALSLFLYRACGGNIPRLTGTVIILMFTLIPLALAGAIFTFAYIDDSILHPGAASFSRVGMWTLMVASNTILYLMMVAANLKQQAWKWPVLSLMALGSLAIGLFASDNYIEASRPLMLFLGLVWTASGAGTLAAYIRHTHTPEAA